MEPGCVKMLTLKTINFRLTSIPPNGKFKKSFHILHCQKTEVKMLTTLLSVSTVLLLVFVRFFVGLFDQNVLTAALIFNIFIWTLCAGEFCLLCHPQRPGWWKPGVSACPSEASPPPAQVRPPWLPRQRCMFIQRWRSLPITPFQTWAVCVCVWHACVSCSKTIDWFSDWFTQIALIDLCPLLNIKASGQGVVFCLTSYWSTWVMESASVLFDAYWWKH